MSVDPTAPGWTDGARETAALMRRARSVLAYGGLDGVITRPLFHESGTFPQFAVAASGCRLTDSTGQTYLDWANGWGPVMLGYRHPAVERAITEQLEAGPTLSLMHPIEIEVAEQVCSMVPSAEMVVFGKNGSDVVNAALRVARAATGRDVVLQHGFHGFHEWHQVQNEGVRGVPRVLGRLVDPFDYDDLDGLRRLLRRRRRRPAAVIMEPTNTFEPPPGYLEGVRELTTRYGALLIFDEMVTAFRLARGGAQEAYGVLPDLTCMGKAMGNGMPIAALAGPREYMQLVPSVGYGMTFRGETLSLAAARVVLRTIDEEPVTEHLATVGETMRHRFEALADEAGVPCRLLGPAARMTISFAPQGSTSIGEIRAAFLQECLRHGVMTNGTLLASYAHDPQAVDESLERMGDALGAVRARLDAGDGTGHRPTGGSPFGPRVLEASGFLEQAEVRDGELRLSGWIALSGRAPRQITVTVPDGRVVRPDVTRADDDRHGGEHARFTLTVPSDDVVTAHGHEITLHAASTDGSTYSCPVVLTEVGPDASPGGPYPLVDGVLYL